MEQAPKASNHQKVLIIGSINIDLFYSVDHLPRKSETLKMKFLSRDLGGKGFNQAMNIAAYFNQKKSDCEIFFVGAVGQDGSGVPHLTRLQESEIDTRFVQEIESRSTGVASILIDQDKENIILVDSGANHEFSLEKFKEDFGLYFSQLESDEFTLNIVIQMEMVEEVVREAILFLKEFEASHEKLTVRVFGDVNWPDIFLDPGLSSAFTMINPNEIELNDMLQSANQAPQDLLTDLPLVIVKQGAKGACVVHSPSGFPQNSELTQVLSLTSDPLIKDKVKDMDIVDPTGAGDAFFAFLVGEIITLGISKDLDPQNLERIKKAILVGNCAGFLACTALGACCPPSMEEIQSLIT